MPSDILTVEQAAFTEFMRSWKNNEFHGQRLGQAFYNHFSLHALADQAPLDGLYEADGETALGLIRTMFTFNWDRNNASSSSYRN